MHRKSNESQHLCNKFAHQKQTKRDIHTHTLIGIYKYKARFFFIRTVFVSKKISTQFNAFRHSLFAENATKPCYDIISLRYESLYD